MAKKKGGHGGGGGGHDAGGGLRWLLTYADMITLLLALFIFLYSISTVDAQKAKAYLVAFGQAFGIGGSILETPPGGGGPVPSVDTLATVKQHIQEEQTRIGWTEDLEVVMTKEGLVLRFRDQALFASGSAEIDPAAFPLLDAVGAELRMIPNTIRVDGHTDDVPTGPSSRFASNWGLSAARSAAVVDFLVGRSRIPAGRLSLAGYAANRPIARNIPGIGNARNRRVEVLILNQPADATGAAGPPTPTPVPIEPY